MVVTDAKMKQSSPTPVVVIVDPYSSGKYIVQELHDQAWKMVAVQSSLEMADFWLNQLEPEYFEEVILFQGCMEETLEKLKKYDIKAVTPGSRSHPLILDVTTTTSLIFLEVRSTDPLILEVTTTTPLILEVTSTIPLIELSF